MLRIKLHEANGGDIVLGSGEYVIVPRLTAEPTCEVMLPGHRTKLSTGNFENERTVRDLARL